MSSVGRQESADRLCKSNLHVGSETHEGGPVIGSPAWPPPDPEPRPPENDPLLVVRELELERQLLEVSKQLIGRYSADQNWSAVSQLALTLTSNQERIDCLKHQLEEDSAPPPKVALSSGAHSSGMAEASVELLNSHPSEEDSVRREGEGEDSVKGDGLCKELSVTEDITGPADEVKKDEEEEEEEEEEEGSNGECFKSGGITTSVVKMSESQCGGVYYQIGSRDTSGQQLFKSVDFSLEEFHKLFKRLRTKVDGIELQEFHSSVLSVHSSESEEESDDECEKLAGLLNRILQDSELLRDKELCDILERVGALPQSSTLPENNRDSSEAALCQKDEVAKEVSSLPINGEVPPSQDAQENNSPSVVEDLNIQENWVEKEEEEEKEKEGEEEEGEEEEGREEELFSPVSNSTVTSNSDDTSRELVEDKWPEKTHSTPVLTEGVDALEEVEEEEEEAEGASGDFPTKAVSSEDLSLEGKDIMSPSGTVKRERSLPSIFTFSLKKGKAGRWKSVSFRKSPRSPRFRKKNATNSHPSPDIVRPMPLIPTAEWDPTCLLEELYSDHKPITMRGRPSGEVARHYGYLEKLPINQSKQTMLKSWKRRYFRVMEGKVYYSEDRTSPKALGFCHLFNSKITLIPEKQQIQVTQSNGKFVRLRAQNSTDMNEWHRALLLESAHPTLSPALSPTPQRENPVLIVDIGACSVRAGFAEENAYPEVYIPAVCSFDSKTMEPIDCGLQALLPQNRYQAQLVYPRKPTLRMDKSKHDGLNMTALQAIIETVLSVLNIEPSNCYLLLTAPLTNEVAREQLAEKLFASMGFSGLYLQEQAQLALYSYNTTSGIIVDIGDHIDIIPIIDGYTIESGIQRLPFGGNAITENLLKLLTLKSIRYFSETESYINRFIKESLCFVSQDFDEDSAKCEEKPADYVRAVEMERFQLPDHRKVIALDSALFQAPEGLFNPRLWGKDVPGIHELVWKAIQACPIDQRKEMSRKIFLSGGTSLLPGLAERLHKELIALSPKGSVIEVHVSDSRQHAAYLGADVVAKLGAFQEMVVTLDEWNSLGEEALRKWKTS